MGVSSMVVYQEDSMVDLMVVMVEPLELLMEVVKPQEPLTEDIGSLTVDHMASNIQEVRKHGNVCLPKCSRPCITNLRTISF